MNYMLEKFKDGSEKKIKIKLLVSWCLVSVFIFEVLVSWCPICLASFLSVGLQIYEAKIFVFVEININRLGWLYTERKKESHPPRTGVPKNYNFIIIFKDTPFLRTPTKAGCSQRRTPDWCPRSLRILSFPSAQRTTALALLSVGNQIAFGKKKAINTLGSILFFESKSRNTEQNGQRTPTKAGWL